jgi:hypothetical protein
MERLRQLATRASALLLGEEEWKLTMGKNVGWTENRPGISGILRVNFSRHTKAGKKTEVARSNMDVSQRGGKPYDGGDGGNYKNEVLAREDSLRFRLWVELGFPCMGEVIPLMSEAARLEFKRARARERTRAVREQQGRERTEQEEKRWRRRSLVGASRWDAKAAELRKWEAKLREGVRQIVAFLANDGDDEEEETAEEGKARRETAAVIENKAKAQNKLRDQCRMLTVYFGRLAARNERRAAALRDGAASSAAAAAAEAAAAVAAVAAGEWDDILDEMGDGDGDAGGKGKGVEGVHDLADEVAEGFGGDITGRTLREWAAEWRGDGTLSIDMRGRWDPAHLLDDEDVLKEVRRFLSEKAKKHGVDGLSVNAFRGYVNEDLLPRLAADARYRSAIERTLRDGGDFTFTISHTTAHAWMLRAGAERGWFKPGYYTDIHEREDVVLSRVRYLEFDRELSLRDKLWVSMQAVVEVDHSQGHAKLQPGGLNVNTMNMKVSEHPDIIPVRFERHTTTHCSDEHNQTAV